MTPDPMASVPAKWMSVREVADRLGVSRMTIYRWIHAEDLRVYRIGRSIKVDPRDVASLVRHGNTIGWEISRDGAA